MQLQQYFGFIECLATSLFVYSEGDSFGPRSEAAQVL